MQSSTWNFDTLPDPQPEETSTPGSAHDQSSQLPHPQDSSEPLTGHGLPPPVPTKTEIPKYEDSGPHEFPDQAAFGSARPQSQGAQEPFHEETQEARETQGPEEPQPEPQPQPQPSSQRDCWLCHETETVTYEPIRTLTGGTRYRKVYRSDDPDLGRLITPCLCKGTMKYIHEGCLRELRAQGMQENARWQCSRCGFSYHIQRLTWAQYIRSPFLSLAITIVILILAVFLLGFIADPILSLYMDPVGTITDTVASKVAGVEDLVQDEDEDGWALHFIKGIFSLGVLGFAKAFLAMSPWQWYNLRATGVVGAPARRRGTGRDRVEGMNLTLVIIGVFTFLFAVYKGTRAWTAKTLDQAAERVMNVRKGDDSDDEDDFDDAKKTQ